MQIIIVVIQLHNTKAAACVEHVSVQATGQYVYTNISIDAVVHLPRIPSITDEAQLNVHILVFSCRSSNSVVVVVNLIENVWPCKKHKRQCSRFLPPLLVVFSYVDG